MDVHYPITLNGHTYYKEKRSFVRKRECKPVWTIFAAETGSFSYTIDGISGVAEAGDIVICVPDVHLIREVIEPLTFHYILFSYSQSAEEEESEMLRIVRHFFSYKFTASENARLNNNFHHLHLLSRNTDPVSQQWKNHLVNDIWLLFCMEVRTRKTIAETNSDPLLGQIKHFIDVHASEEITIKELAASIHMHPVQLARRFQTAFGVNPYQYLSSVRINKAKTLLVQTEYTIDHIAHECGYANGFYLSRVFTNMTGTTPSQYRKMHAVMSP